jgi:hypothetical protein
MNRREFGHAAAALAAFGLQVDGGEPFVWPADDA